MTSSQTWERRHERRLQLEAYRRKESAQRAELRPLRNAVNKALKEAGIRHSVTHYSSRVKGWPISTSEGWETESVYWSDPKYIRVEITAYVGGAGHKYDHARDAELRALAEKALSVFDYKAVKHGYQETYEVYGLKS
jgi:hypothetical protein